MKLIGFDANQSIVLKQGERNSNLYFVKKGQLRMFFMQDNKEKVIKNLNPGDIFGEDTFFNLTVCTASVTASSGTEVNFLEKDILAEWGKKDLGLESKLRDYTLKLKKTSDLLLEKGLDRRCMKRVKTSSRVSLQSLDTSDTPIGEPIAATLEDISRGGVSFTLKITKEKILGLFMEPKVNLKYSINMSDSQKDMDQNGTVVAVINHFYDYSVHVKFDKMLDEKTIEDVIPSSESEYGELELETDS